MVLGHAIILGKTVTLVREKRTKNEYRFILDKDNNLQHFVQKDQTYHVIYVNKV